MNARLWAEKGADKRDEEVKDRRDTVIVCAAILESIAAHTSDYKSVRSLAYPLNDSISLQ